MHERNSMRLEGLAFATMTCSSLHRPRETLSLAKRPKLVVKIPSKGEVHTRSQIWQVSTLPVAWRQDKELQQSPRALTTDVESLSDLYVQRQLCPAYSTDSEGGGGVTGKQALQNLTRIHPPKILSHPSFPANSFLPHHTIDKCTYESSSSATHCIAKASRSTVALSLTSNDQRCIRSFGELGWRQHSQYSSRRPKDAIPCRSILLI